MKDTKPRAETPPLSRAGRKIADATLAAAKFTPTADGKSAIRKFEVHGMAVTERVSVTDAIPDCKTPEQSKAPIVTALKTTATASKPATPPLTRAGRKAADATLAAAHFVSSSDGKNAMRKFEVYGISVTEFISADKAADSHKTRK
jgi:pyocin large subunit-like protein